MEVAKISYYTLNGSPVSIVNKRLIGFVSRYLSLQH